VLCNMYIYICIYAYDDKWIYSDQTVHCFFETVQYMYICIYMHTYTVYVWLVFFTAWQHPKLLDFLRFVQLLGGRFL
jgi:hypothetical protein